VSQSTVDLLPHDLAVVDALETIGKPVGFAAAPAGALAAVQNKTGPDYLILWPLTTSRDGTLGDPYTDAEPVYQITCVGRSAAGVRWLVDQIEPALLTVSVTGRAVIQITPEDGGQVRRDDDVEPPVFIATPRYRISTVPT
jgi:hypothetical protein